MGACGAVGRPGQEADGGVRHWGRSNTDMAEKQRARVSMYVELAGAPRALTLCGVVRAVADAPPSSTRGRAAGHAAHAAHGPRAIIRWMQRGAMLSLGASGLGGGTSNAGRGCWLVLRRLPCTAAPCPTTRRNRLHVVGALDRPASSIEHHPASGVQHLASSIQHPAPATAGASTHPEDRADPPRHLHLHRAGC